MKKILCLFLFTHICAQAATEKTIHVGGSMSNAPTWMEFTSSEELNIQKLLELLKRSPTGVELIDLAQAKASRAGKKLTEVIKAGEGSVTDTTLVRKFSPDTPERVDYEVRSVVYINRKLAWDDALLDLAHELTHFVYRDGFNPYAENFNLKDFIKSTIEGMGGEAQAFIYECRVHSELFKAHHQGRNHCHNVKDEQGKVSMDKAIELFYHVGPYYDALHKQLTKRDLASEFSHLKNSKINFVSSAYGLPYPVAAMMEFDLVMNKVCENDRKRLAFYKSDSGRSPASAQGVDSKFVQSYNSRCK